MSEFENQLNAGEGEDVDDIVSMEAASLTVKPQKNWLDYLLFWCRKAPLPVARKDLSPVIRLNRLPAIMLGALLVLSLLNTDLEYWNSMVNDGSLAVSVPVTAVEVSYFYLTKPLNYTLSRTVNLVKKTEVNNLAAVILSWTESAHRGYGIVIRTLAEKENQLISRLEETSRDSSLALIQESNNFKTNLIAAKEKNISQPIELIKEKASKRRGLLEARALAVADQTTLAGSEFLSSIKRGALVVREGVSSLPPQTATIWNSAVLGNLEKVLETYRGTCEKMSLRAVEWTLFLDNGLLWLETLPVRLSQKVSATWTSIMLKTDSVASSWRAFMNPSKGISPEALEEIKKAVAEEITKNLQGQSGQNVSGARQASYGAVVVPSTGDLQADEKIKRDLENQFSDEVSISFDKSGQAGVVTPIFENGQRGGDYVFMLTPIKQ